MSNINHVTSEIDRLTGIHRSVKNIDKNESRAKKLTLIKTKSENPPCLHKYFTQNVREEVNLPYLTPLSYVWLTFNKDKNEDPDNTQCSVSNIDKLLAVLVLVGLKY